MNSKIALKKDFELLESIGKGVSSEVYKGLRIEPGSDFSEVVAIKIYKSAKFRKKYQNELKNLSKINHPNIIFVKDWGESQEKFYLVTEYVHGQDLATLLKSLDKKDLKMKKFILNQIFEGLKELSNKGIAHGDLKPSNIMISVKGELKLIDISFDDLGQVFATPEFSAPEILSGFSVNFKSDLYSMGVIARRMNVPLKKLLSIEPGDRSFEPFKGLDKFEERDKLSSLVRESFLEIEPVDQLFEFTQELQASEASYMRPSKPSRKWPQRLQWIGVHLLLALIFGLGVRPQFPIVKAIKLRSSKAYEFWNEGTWVSLPYDKSFFFSDGETPKKLKFRSHSEEKNVSVSSKMDFSKNLIIDAL